MFACLCPFIIGLGQPCGYFFVLTAEFCQKFIIAHVFLTAKLLLKFRILFLKLRYFSLQLFQKTLAPSFLGLTLLV